MAGLLDFVNRGMANPLTHLGMGLMASSQPRYSTNIADLNGGGVGAGLLTGMDSFQRYQGQQQERAIRGGLLQAKQQEALLKQQEAQREHEAAQAQAAAGEAFRKALATPGFPREQLAALAHAAGAKPGGLMPPANDPNKPFAPDGSPNQPAQDFALRKSAAGGVRIGDITAGGTGPAFGNVEPGYVMRQDGEGGWYQAVIPGSKADRAERRADRESQEKLAGAMAKNRSDFAKAEKVSADVTEAIDMVNKWSTGAGGMLFSGIPSTDAKILRGRISTIKSAIATDTLAAMRSLSSTGSSGLGALSAPELKLLEDSIASLDPDAGDEELVRNFKKVATHYNNLMTMFKEDRARLESPSQPTTKPSSPDLSEDKQKRLEALRKKYGVGR